MAMKTVKTSWVLAGGLLSALSASVCCVGPMVALALGAGTFVASGWMVAWRPIFLFVTTALLLLAWVMTLSFGKVKCAKGTVCATAGSRRRTFAALIFSTVIVVAIAFVPDLTRAVLQAMSQEVTREPSQQVLRMKIPSMDCAACAVGISHNLRRTEGVRFAEVDFTTKTAVVAYDPSTVLPETLIARVDATGFKAEPIQ